MPIRVRLAPGDIDVNDAEVHRFLANPDGPLAKDMERRGDNMLRAAILECPVGEGGGVGERPGGTLASTIRKQMDYSGLPAVEILAGKAGLTDYLGYVLGGTKPHVITPIPNRKNPHLRFRPRGSGEFVFARSTNHPGTRADPFLQRALLQANS